MTTWKQWPATKLSATHVYDVILSPIVTEKTTRGSEFNQITFRVPLTASKPEIKQAVETLFRVQVTKVNTLIAEGKTNRQIAQELEVAVKTVDTHRCRLMQKLNIHDQAALIKYALRRGIVGL